MNITANEVKTKGVSVFDDALKQGDEVVINVRGKNKYVVLDIDRYNDFRANGLDILYIQAMQDIKNGDYQIQTAEEHIKYVNDLLE
ncbi:prevent-host-death protein [Candidatus Ruthia endofausta]|uniref:Prevent-host-death protein n=1 Tax=Candidatus Ruthia endofausta TaxID=2738852 RepID=A0A6N0HQA2_9GAMM|nr:prevent-host-death protein [Candidatus Ruthia endofausta]QKQ24507.1 prevent-host-death protein [Candidatus Ruthia endofausta]